MTSIFVMELWLPILLAAGLVFIASSIMHMVVPLHKSDYKPLPDEDPIVAAMRAADLSPGAYNFPHCGSMKDLGSEEMLAKFERGPVGFVTILPNGPPAMGKALVLWFLYCILVGFCAAYVTAVALPRGADYMQVFQIAGTVAILIYATSAIPDSIWKGQSWTTTGKFMFEGIIYGLLTAGTFAWLWPAGA